MSLFTSNIVGVKFQLTGSNTASEDSYGAITEHHQYRNNEPYPGGVYDAHLGTTDHAYRCQTCQGTKTECIGHEGHIKLNYPVWNPIAAEEGRKWLRLICFNCGKPTISSADYARYSKSNRLTEASKISNNSNRKCVHCGAVHPIIKHDRADLLVINAEFYEDKRLVTKQIIYPHIAEQVFERISDSTVIEMGKSPMSHPRNFILRVVKVPAVTIRPDVKKIGGGRSTNDDLTTMLQLLIKKNNDVPLVIPNELNNAFDRAVWELNSVYYDFVRGSKESTMVSLADRLKGKEGRLRKHQMGKRVFNMCRTTITGNPRIHIDELGVPMVFAKTIQMIEIVQPWNIARLSMYVANGRKRYPGASKVIKHATGVAYDTEREIELAPGDIVYRDALDGEYWPFNRQPTLTISSIGAHRIKILQDDRIRTFNMNVIACSLYNADFDGDQMNTINCIGIAEHNEVAQLSWIGNWFISHTTSSPVMGQTDDSIIGMAELTVNGVELDKYHTMLLYQDSYTVPDFSDMRPTDRISGRNAVSRLLKMTPVNFARNPEWYDQSLTPYIKYDPSDIRVVIKNGEIISGVLDKKSVGKGAAGGLYHLLFSKYGARVALDVMYNMQQVAIGYTKQKGYTIGVADLVIPLETKAEVDKISSDIIAASLLIAERLHNGEIIPPIDRTVSEYYEELQINALRIFDDFTPTILRGIDPLNNNLFKLILSGSKGKRNNMINMTSSIGQQLINGERIRMKFGLRRTLPYFSRFDPRPIARGYIANSFIAGMTPIEYIYNAMAARFDLFSKSLSTATTGAQNRRSIKSLESIIVSNLYSALKNRNIVQLVYGEDALDPRYIERVKFPTVMIGDEELAAKFKHDKFPEEFQKIVDDRNKYRELFMKIERVSTREPFTDECLVPVDVARVVNDMMTAYEMSPDGNLSDKVKMVREYVDDLPYILVNSIQRKKRTQLPLYIQRATWLSQMLIRSVLNPNALEKIPVSMLKLILERITAHYSRAIIDPGTPAGIIAAQCFSEPLTQYMLDSHHRSASGGTSYSTMTRAEEILGAHTLDKMHAPTMYLPLKPVVENGVSRPRTLEEAQNLANNIEAMRMGLFVTTWQTFFEKFAEPVHSMYEHERELCSEFQKMNPLLKPPGDLVRWCIRFVLNKSTLILKNMSLSMIISRMREAFPDAYFIYSKETDPQIVIRVYMRNSMFKSAITAPDVRKIKDELLNTIIRGVEGIVNAAVVKSIRNTVQPDGSVKAQEQYAITTNGCNFRGVMAVDGIDTLGVLSDATHEVSRVLGIESARQSIVTGLRSLVDSCNYRHLLVYADEMTYTGRYTSIDASGVKSRETANVLLRMGFNAPLRVLEEAAIEAMEDAVTGVTAPILVGNVPRLGTLYNQMVLDTEFVKQNIKPKEDLLAGLY